VRTALGNGRTLARELAYHDAPGQVTPLETSLRKRLCLDKL
jgi:hypothetical protein